MSALITIDGLDLDAPKGPWPVWPDEDWVRAIITSKLGPPRHVRLQCDTEEGLCITFDFGDALDATVVLSVSPRRRRGAHIAERAAPFCWSPSEIFALLNDIADGRGWTTLEATLASLVAPERRA